MKEPPSDVRICIDLRLVKVGEMHRAVNPENYKMHSSTFADLDDESRGLTTFMTHMGFFRYEVLMFGLCSASEIFQRIMEQEPI